MKFILNQKIITLGVSTFMFLFLSTIINLALPAQAQWSVGGEEEGELGEIANSAGLPSQKPENVLIRVINFLLAALIFLTVLAFISAGIVYITGGGDPKKVELATNIVKYTIIGLIIALLGYVVIITIDGVLKD